MSWLPASIKRIRSKTTEKRRRHHFPHCKSMGAFCCHGNQCFDPVCPKTLRSLSPTPVSCMTFFLYTRKGSWIWRIKSILFFLLLRHPFLAHLSRRLTRWTYSIPMVRRPSSLLSSVIVRRRPHFQTWISLKPVGQSWSYFMSSITGVGERLHKVLGQIGSKLWLPWQQKAPIDL